MAAERAVQFARAGDLKAGDLRAAASRIAAIGGGPAANTAAVKENWAVRVWNMLYAGVSAIAAAALWLIG